ncbi:MAG: PEP-CTERM sorting domain-containing protein [Planctomycetota bacterium]|nr:PEP-CTERM sorting domain-containing protein [Planctomycetota bacterium]
MSVGNLVRMVCLAVLCANAGQVQAEIISAFDRGWYDSNGFHDPTNQNYVATNFGISALGPDRNFFVFNLDGFSTSETITSASLRLFTSADAGTFVTVNLNAAGLSALNAARGGTFATGGTWSSPRPNSFVFGGNFAGNLNDSSLVYETSAVPEPASLALSGIGALGVGLVARRRVKKLSAM